MWGMIARLTVNWQELRENVAYSLIAVSCLFFPLDNAQAGKCSKIRLSANCANTPHAYGLKQIRSGRSANANSASKILIRLNESEIDTEDIQNVSRKNNNLNGNVLIHPPDAQTAEILTRLGIPVLPGIPPIIIILPEDNDKNEDN
jgi:hypothetical protein